MFFEEADGLLEALFLEAGEFEGGAIGAVGFGFFLEEFVECFDEDLVGGVGFAAKF